MTPLTESQELAILESDARLHLALAAGRMGIWEWDAVTNKVMWNGTEHRISGVGEERSITPEQFFNVVHPDDRHRVEYAFRAAAETQASFEAEFRIIRTNGEERWLVGRGMALVGRDGRTSKVVGVNFDITDRKRSEQARQHAESKLREAHGLIKTITDNATTAIFMMDGDGATTFMNPAAEAMVGFSFAEVRAQPLHDLVHHFHVDDEPVQMDECCIGKSILTQRTVREHEDVFVDRGGRTFPVRCNVSPIFKNDELAGIVLEVRDISAEKRAQQALEEADRRKDRFLATLAHELRNPLAPIRSALHVLRAAEAAAPSDVVWATQLMDRQVAQLVRLIDDLLDISRITLDKMTLQFESAVLGDIIDCAVETSRPGIEERGHRFAIELPATPVLVRADATRLAQVLSNLLNNAAKYSDPGAMITLSVMVDETMAIISVRDTGKGIRPELLSHIFSMYAQGDRPAEQEADGLGIGLALVKKLVDLHRGSVEAHSNGLNAGSEFIVRIPLAAVGHPVAHEPIALPSLENSFKPLRILVVDDNVDAADALALALAGEGYDAHTAYSGREALDTAMRLQPDAVVLDIGMSDMNGYDVARCIRRERWGADISLIALTGWGQVEDRTRALEAGFDHHVTKPADPQELMRLLRSPQRNDAARYKRR
jgi:PAS domain S-box-containing protein